MSQDPTQNRPGYLVKRVQQLLRQACDEGLRPVELSMSQYAVLRALSDHPDIPAAELARRCFVTRQSLRDVLNGLRKADLVSVAEQATTGRARPVALTAEGRKRLRAADEVVTETETRMLTGFSAGEQDRLSALLARCADNLSA
ncbi:MarR family transcriptional regulator [Saccharopolyspora sp. NPDC050389]|uniref:MarR family winged helix-turn-helix transcriptional regulator n=1 Tax=Saccharopolyspora sp. NPDC050389 TaxID=3155516 RepID=UPI0033F7F715